jgi:hypothetical protein
MLAILAAPPAAIVLAITLYSSMQGERAALTITRIGFDPFPLVANQRELLVISFKNTGHNYATIDAVATDRAKTNFLTIPFTIRQTSRRRVLPEERSWRLSPTLGINRSSSPN